MPSGFPSQMASNMIKLSISWHHPLHCISNRKRDDTSHPQSYPFWSWFLVVFVVWCKKLFINHQYFNVTNEECVACFLHHVQKSLIANSRVSWQGPPLWWKMMMNIRTLALMMFCGSVISLQMHCTVKHFNPNYSGENIKFLQKSYFYIFALYGVINNKHSPHIL